MSTPASKEASLHLKEAEEPSDSENELKRKMSSVSVYSTDGGEDDYDDGEDDDDDRKSAHVVLGPQLALKEQLEMDKDDESLRKWKEQLLAGVDLSQVGENLDPEVKIQSLTIITPDRPDFVLSIPFVPNAKGYAFSLKDGSRYRLKFSFTFLKLKCTATHNEVQMLMFTKINILEIVNSRIDLAKACLVVSLANVKILQL